MTGNREPSLDRQRIDKWLWHARVVRTRSAAASLVTSGHVRVNGARTTAASHLLRVDDAVTIALDRTVRVLKVIGFAERRGASDSVAVLYEDLAPRAPKAADAPPPEPGVAEREPGSGRPTKRDRRMIDRLGDESD
jgi:ribosome-associated heat shock protein Hsp15